MAAVSSQRMQLLILPAVRNGSYLFFIAPFQW
jgi:hypothetical protein